MYGGEEPPDPNVEKMGSRKKKLSSSMIPFGEMKWTIATRSVSDEEDEVREAETKETGMEVVEKVIKKVKKEAETKIIEKMGTERS